MTARKTIAVLGGGSAGFTAARTAAGLGARVLFFMGDNADMASLCVNRGCMPSKAMFEPIDALHHARHQGFAKVEALQPDRYLEQVVRWKDREIARFRAYRQRAIAASAADDFVIVRANATFTGPQTLEAAGESYEFDRVILACGSVPAIPPIDGLADLGGEIWGNDEILSNTRLPESVAFVGAGAIGLEFALRYARLGCRVTVVARSRPLSAYPEAFGLRLAEIYESENIRVMLSTATRRVRRDVEGWFVLDTEGPGGYEPVAVERVVLAAGRRPALESLGLDRLGVATDARGRLQVGADMRVEGSEAVFAAGDVIGRHMVVHQAHLEAGIAADNAVTDGNKQWQRRADLQVVFSDPEFAWAGATPDAAAREGIDVVSASKESRLIGKLHLAGDDSGFGEMYADATTHRLLGAGLLCQDASNLIHLPGYMIDHEHTVHDGATAEYYHPSRIEIVSSIMDGLCEQLGGRPPRRADEKTG